MFTFPLLQKKCIKFNAFLITFIIILSSSLVINDFGVDTAALKFENDTDTSTANIIFQGEKSYDEAASSVSLTPDVNGDGIDDILIGSEYYDSTTGINTGKTYIIFGHSTSWTYQHYLFNSPASFIGENQYDRAGIITPAGDVNGDGIGDILVGAPFNDDGGGLSTQWTDGAGQVYLIFGKTSGLEPNKPLSNADASYLGEDLYDNIGYHISTAGDFNGDGFDDFLISTPNKDDNQQNAGKVYLIFGKESDWVMNYNLSDAECSFVGESESDQLHVVANAGDINKDGYDDILLGSPENDDGGDNAGKVYLIYGYPGGWKPDISVADAANASFVGEKTGDKLSKVSGVGDVNGDGFDDFLIGSPENNEGGTSAGKSYLIFGKKEFYHKGTLVSDFNSTFIGENANDRAANLAGVGDVNGDGYSDFTIAAPYNDKGGTDSGQVYLFLGKSSNWKSGTDVADADASFLHNQVNGRAGILIGRYQPGDINDDGFDDVLIGVPGYSVPGNSDTYGQGYIFFMEINKRPTSINRLSTYSDPEYSKSIEKVDLDELVFVEVQGDDQDPARKNLAEIYVKSKNYDTNGISVLLTETSENSGIFRGSFYVTTKTHQSHNWIGCYDIDELTLISSENPGLTKHLPVGPRVKIKDIALIDGSGADARTIYNEHKTYTLKILVNNALGCSDLNSVILGWEVSEPGKEQKERIKLAWHSSSEKFEIISAPVNWLSFYEPRTECFTNQNNYVLFFNLNFHWLYPENTTTKMSIQSISATTGSQWTNISLEGSNYLFRTVNRVWLKGDLEVVGELQGSLEEGGWVLGSEALTWSGLRAVYMDELNNETVNLRPGSARIKTTDTEGNEWFTPIPATGNIIVESNAPDVDNKEIEFEFSLADVPANSDFSDIRFSLMVTSLKPSAPLNLIIRADNYEDSNILADNDNELFISWDTPVGHRWNITGFYYSTSNNEFSDEGISTGENRGMIILPDDYLGYAAKEAKVFVWAVDQYGSIGPSIQQSMIIDTVPVEFENSNIESGALFGDTEITINIMVTDEGGSGVDGSSIAYRKSTSGLDGWTTWNNLDETMIGSEIFCSITTTFVEGEDNYFQWRAADLAGNGLTYSEKYKIVVNTNVDNSPPTVTLFSPLNKTTITTDIPILSWNGFDAEADSLTYDVYLSNDLSKVELGDPSVLIGPHLQSSQFQLQSPLNQGETYYWTVIPYDGISTGTCEMDIWSFKVDILLKTSATNLLLPHDNSIISTLKPTLMWKVAYEGKGEQTIHYDVYLDTVPNPSRIVSAGQMENTYRPIYPLDNGMTYYWKVIPYLNNVKGTCLSGVWRFKIDLDFNYEINLASEYVQLSLVKNDFKSIELSISNKGTQPDTIRLSVESEHLKDINFNTTEVILPRNDKGYSSLSIYIPPNTDPGTYSIRVRAVSEGARIQGQDVSDEVVIVVKVQDSKAEAWDKELVSLLSVLIILIIILNLALAFSFILVRRNKKDMEKFRTLYYVQKYSKKKRLRNKTDGGGLEINRTLPVLETQRVMDMKQMDESEDTEFNYTIPERMAILKYLRKTGKITERQYHRGLLSIRSWAKVPPTSESNNGTPKKRKEQSQL